jgi:hypothetical protein
VVFDYGVVLPRRRDARLDRGVDAGRMEKPMSDLIERLRRAADDAALIAMPCAGEAADRIEQLKARLDRAVTRGLEQVERIATLEAALNKLACWHVTEGPLWWQSVARAALAPEQDK